MENQETITNTQNVRFALLGDVEPKPEPVFSNLEKAVKAINRVHERDPLDFVAGIGDIPHKGTVVQYEGATESLKELKVDLFSIMGNEELGGGVERFLEYASQWSNRSPEQVQLNYTKYFGRYVYIFVTATVNGVRFSDSDLDWLEEQLKANAGRPLVLFTHAPVQGIFAVEERRTIPNKRFNELLQHPDIHLHFSGHTHMDPDFVATHVADPAGIHYIHIPGIERTKVGNVHTPRIRFVTMQPDGKVEIQTYNLAKEDFEEEHKVTLRIP